MSEESRAITDVKLEPYTLYLNAVGDTWDPAWAADDRLYCLGNDGSGWDKACSSNLFFNVIAGSDPAHLTGQTVNGMKDYCGWAEHGPDGATWKSSGTLALDGALYQVVGRHTYGDKSGDPFNRQTARRASIIRSTDGGLTWTRSAQENYDQPMFESGRFATPYFIHYGQEGQTPPVDGADRYVYAISNNGFWSNGDNYILGRVERARIARLDGADWQYYRGGDGLSDENWTHNPDEAQLIIDNPRKCGETGATYLPAIDRYILVAWYYPGIPSLETQESHFVFYEAPKPWGPWTLVRDETIFPEGWYCPRVLSKWQKVGEGEVEAVIMTGGDYYDLVQYYRLTMVPVRLKLSGTYPRQPQPKPLVIDSSSEAVQYQGRWTVDEQREKAHNGRECYSDDPGATFTLNFEGTRLQWYTSNEGNLGIAAVSIDGGEEHLVDLWTYSALPQYNRLVYDSGALTPGAHTFRVRVTGQKREKAKGTGIFHDRVEITPAG